MRFVLLISCIGWSTFLFTQPFHLEVFDTQDGLISTDIRSLLQDSKGYLWIGTAVGLSRYDGYDFKNFTQSDGLPKGSVTEIIEVEDGNLWVITEKGVAYYNKERFYPIHFRNESKSAELLQSIYLRSNGQLWVGSNRGLAYLDHKKWKMAISHPDTSFFFHFPSNYSVFDFEENSEKQLIFGSFNQLISYQNAQFDTIGITTDNPYNQILEIFPLAPHKTWIGTTEAEVFQYSNNKQSTIIPFQSGKSKVSSIISYNQSYWILDEDGIRILYADGAIHSLSLYKKLGIKLMRCMIKDRENSIWVGSNEGLIRITPRDFELYHQLNKLAPNGIFSLTESPENKLLVASNHGKVFQKEVTNEFSQIPLPKGISSAEIVGIFYDKNNNLWLTTYWDGIFKITDHHIKKIWYEDGFFAGADINFGFASSQNDIWIGHNFGISKLNEGLNETISITNYKEFSKINFQCFVEDLNQTTWFGTDNGLYYFNEDTIIRFPLKEELSITGLCIDRTGKLWIATQGRGVYAYEITAHSLKQVHHFDTSNGLSTDFLLDIIPDDQGNIWIGHYKGFSILRNNLAISNYNPEDGLIEKAYQKIRFHKDINGIIWAATTMGLMSFNPSEIIKNEVESLINIDAVLVDGQAINHTSINQKNSLQLPHDKNDIRFEFTAISLKNPSKIKYKYWLKSGMKDWSPSTDERGITFNALSPNKYEFNLIACNNDQVWNKKAFKFAFEICPPFWRQWWFILSCLFVAIVSALFIIQRRELKIKKEEQEKSRINQMITELETRALRAQMNPHFIFNSLNAIQECILTEKIDAAYDYLFKFSRLLRRVLEHSSKSLISVENEIEILQLYLELESLRFDNSFEFNIQVEDTEDDIEDMFLPSLMIQPFVENAIWHGLMHKNGSRLLQITFKENHKGLICLIEDNGIGRAAAKALKKKRKFKHQSLALQLVSDRLKIIEQQTEKIAQIQIIDKKDESGIACGTIIKIELPNDLIPHSND